MVNFDDLKKMMGINDKPRQDDKWSQGMGSMYPTGDPITPKDANAIPWGDMHRQHQRDVGERLEQSALEELATLRQKVQEQDQHLREEAWFCTACKASFPKMLVKTSFKGTLQCPRCRKDDPGIVVRAVEAVRSTFQTMVDGLEARVVELLKENAKLKEDLIKARLRPGQGRVVEGD